MDILDPSVRDVLVKAGISEAYFKDEEQIKFILEFLQNRGGIQQLKPTSPAHKAPPKLPPRRQSGQTHQQSNQTRRQSQNVPPPLPSRNPGTSSTSESRNRRTSRTLPPIPSQSRSSLLPPPSKTVGSQSQTSSESTTPPPTPPTRNSSLQNPYTLPPPSLPERNPTSPSARNEDRYQAFFPQNKKDTNQPKSSPSYDYPTMSKGSTLTSRFDNKVPPPVTLRSGSLHGALPPHPPSVTSILREGAISPPLPPPPPEIFNQPTPTQSSFKKDGMNSTTEKLPDRNRFLDQIKIGTKLKRVDKNSNENRPEKKENVNDIVSALKFALDLRKTKLGPGSDEETDEYTDEDDDEWCH